MTTWETDTQPIDIIEAEPNVTFIAALDQDWEQGYKPKRVPKPKPGKNTHHVLAEGENIQTVAELYLPKGMARKDYAKALFAKNKRWSTGALIEL